MAGCLAVGQLLPYRGKAVEILVVIAFADYNALGRSHGLRIVDQDRQHGLGDSGIGNEHYIGIAEIGHKHVDGVTDLIGKYQFLFHIWQNDYKGTIVERRR